jgi:hypothetical protein
MTVLDLMKDLLAACQRIAENGDTPDEVCVSIQIDGGPESVWSETISVEYDGNGQVSGLVILGLKDAESDS